MIINKIHYIDFFFKSYLLDMENDTCIMLQPQYDLIILYC